MRAILTTFLFTLGAVTMSPDVIDAQEKKDPPKMEKVTLRVWDPQGKKFLNAKEGRDVVHGVYKDGQAYLHFTSDSTRGVGAPVKGSEIIDSQGVVWVVESMEGGSRGGYKCVVKAKKP